MLPGYVAEFKGYCPFLAMVAEFVMEWAQGINWQKCAKLPGQREEFGKSMVFELLGPGGLGECPGKYLAGMVMTEIGEDNQ